MSATSSVVGIGSPFGADNLGQRAIDALRQPLSDLVLSNKIQLTYYDRPGLALLEYLKPFDTVHLIDAVVSGASAGTIHRFENVTDFQQSCQVVSTHDFGLAQALALGNVLGYLPNKLIIHGFEIDDENFSELKFSTFVEQLTTEIQTIVLD
jgi:hydrogenase maturation protease